MIHISDGVITAIITGVVTIITIAEKYYFEKKYKKKKADDKTDLMEHPFFVRVDMLKNYIQLYFTLANKAKEAIFKDILTNMLDITKEHLYNLTKQIEEHGEEYDYQTMFNMYIENFRELLIMLHTYYVHNSKYSNVEVKALDIVFSKFEVLPNTKTDFIQEAVQSICNSPFYESNKIKAAVLLDLYLSVCVETINSAGKTLNNINGDLKGLSFNGIEF